MLYPMNALVSDQLGRLRRMIGNGEKGFHSLLREIVPGKRVPQFGMYTGRTPYFGKADKVQAIMSYRNHIINKKYKSLRMESII